MNSSDWRALGDTDHHSLSETRLQAHYAVQWLARAARAFIAAKPDDGHTSFRWEEALDKFSTDALPNGMRLGLSITTLTLVLLDAARGRYRQSLTLLGHRDKDARAWLGAQV